MIMNLLSKHRINSCISLASRIGRHHDPLATQKYHRYNRSIWEIPHYRKKPQKGSHWYRDEYGNIKKEVISVPKIVW